jgi:hypothetical protein
MNLEKLVGVVVSVVSKDLALFWLQYKRVDVILQGRLISGF